MRTVILTSRLRGTASYCLPLLIRDSQVQIVSVIYCSGQKPPDATYYRRRLRKILKIGLPGALNGIRIRSWFQGGPLKMGVGDLKDICTAAGIPFHETPYISHPETERLMRAAEADIGLSLGNGYIPPRVFQAPRLGMLNIHAEELPKFQNAQSVIWQLYEGSAYTGYTIHKIEKKIDTGQIVYQERYPIRFCKTLEETVRINVDHTLERSGKGLVRVMNHLEKMLSEAITQGSGRHYTTPGIFQFMRMQRNHRQLRKQVTPEPSLHVKPRILLLSDWFEPGFKGGGPIRSAVNFVHHFRDEADIWVLTGDRDFGDEQPYPLIETNTWLNKDGYHVYYAHTAALGMAKLEQLIRDLAPDFIYLNSMFSLPFAIRPLMLLWKGRISAGVVLCPRGMLRRSALSHKPWKKQIFLAFLKRSGVQCKICFHATDQTEAEDIRRIFPGARRLVQAANLPARAPAFESPPLKDPGYLNLIFVGRVHPIKQLDYLLTALQHTGIRGVLTLVAPVEDKGYWKKCEPLLRSVQDTMQVRHLENLPHEELASLIRQHHLFVLPTRGENYGHAIVESMANGRPVLISDQTPWRQLAEHKAGMDLPLEAPGQFHRALEQFAAMNDQEFRYWCEGAYAFHQRFQISASDLDTYRDLFGMNAGTVSPEAKDLPVATTEV